MNTSDKRGRSTAIITGASRGIGRETAIELAKTKRYDVIAITCSKSEADLKIVEKEIEDLGIECISAIVDGGDFYGVKGFIDALTDYGCDIDLLINNAAISYVGLLTDMSLNDWNETLSSNLTSVFNMTRHVAPHMISKKDGRIINVSSVWGLAGASMEVAYSASKGAVNSLTKALAKELALSNISVNAVAFGAIDTEMNSHLSKEEKTMLEDEIAIGRMATVKEAAEAIIKISEMPKYMTGEIIKVDGGWI